MTVSSKQENPQICVYVIWQETTRLMISNRSIDAQDYTTEVSYIHCSAGGAREGPKRAMAHPTILVCHCVCPKKIGVSGQKYCCKNIVEKSMEFL